MNLDALMRFLVESIALSGDEGASTHDCVSYINSYYCRDHLETTGQDLAIKQITTQAIDRPFQERIWEWLSEHPYIRIGRNGQANGLSLTQVELFNERSGISNTGDNQQNSSAPRVQAMIDESSSVEPRADAIPLLKDQGTLRAYSTHEQMWLAAAGHGPNNDKIQRLDFQCLMVIASHREKGVLQPDLVQITGQDKRSVPVRTQRLHDNGYISKITVTARATRTSMLFLRRFAPRVRLCSNDKQVSLSGSLRVAGTCNSDVKYTKFQEHEQLIRRALEIIKEHKIIIWNDLKRKLDIMLRPSDSKLFAEAVRRLEGIGCLLRVRAAGVVKRPGKVFHRCVKLLREPKEEDWRALFDLRAELSPKSSPLNDRDPEETVEYPDEGYHIDSSIFVDDSHEEIDKHRYSLSRDPVPQWVPDRPLAHILYDIALLSGINGVSFSDMKERAVGAFFSRPVELLVGRLVDFWQISQPSYLRHLALVRDAAQVGKTGFYIHYTWNSFQLKVEYKEAAWESVQTLEEPDIGTSPDEFGFPVLEASQFCGNGVTVTLPECIKAARARAFRIARKDTPTYLQSGGSHELQFALRKAQHDQRSMQISGQKHDEILENIGLIDLESGQHKDTERRVTSIHDARMRNKEAPMRPRGRPRKHPKTCANFTRVRERGQGQTEEERVYLPSMAAHTLLSYTISPSTPSGFSPASKRVFSSRKAKSAIGRLPSTLVHNLLPSSIDEPSGEEQQDTLPDATVSNPGHLPFLADDSVTRVFPDDRLLSTDYIPLSASLTPEEITQSPSLSNLSSHAASVSKKRQASSQSALVLPMSGKRRKVLPPLQAHGTRLPIFSTSDEHTESIFPGGLEKPQLEGMETMRKKGNGTIEVNRTTYKAPKKAQHINREGPRTYDQQLHAIERANTGIFIGPLSFLKVAGRGRPPKSRLAVFKSPRLISMAFFTDFISSNAPNCFKETKSETRNGRPHQEKQSLNFNDRLGQVTSIMSSPLEGCVSPTTNLHEPYQDLHDHPSITTLKRKRALSARTGPEVLSTCPSTLVADNVVSVMATEINCWVSKQHRLEKIGDHSFESICLDVWNERSTFPTDSDTPEPSIAHPALQGAASHAHPKIEHRKRSQAMKTGDFEKDTEAEMLVERTVWEPSTQALLQQPAYSEISNIVPSTPDILIPVSHAVSSDCLQFPVQQTLLPKPDTPSHQPMTKGQDLSSNYNVTVPNQLPFSLQLPQLIPASLPGADRDQARRSPRVRNKAIFRVIPYGGSTTTTRKQLILDIVGMCGGAFPGDRELWYAFTTLWVEQPGRVKPDQRTVRQTKKALIDAGKLQQFAFSFKDKNGIITTKNIIADMDTSASDQFVKDLQEKMIARDPRLYFPKEIHIDPRLTIFHDGTGKEIWPKILNDGLQIETEEVQYHYTPTKTARANASKKIKMSKSNLVGPTDPGSKLPLLEQDLKVAHSSPQEPGLPASVNSTVLGHQAGEIESISGASEVRSFQWAETSIPQIVQQSDEPTTDNNYLRYTGRPFRFVEPLGLHSQVDELLSDGVTGNGQSSHMLHHPSSKDNCHQPSSSFVEGLRSFSGTTQKVPQAHRELITSSLEKQRINGTNVGYANRASTWPIHIFHAPTGTFSILADFLSTGCVRPKIVQRNDKSGAEHPSFLENIFQQASMLQSVGSDVRIDPAQEQQLNHVPYVTSHQKPAETETIESTFNKRKRKMQAPKQRVARLASLMKNPEQPAVVRPVIADSRAFKRIRLRGPQTRIILGPGGDRRIFVASIMLRCLAGGVDQTLDWNLLAKVFEPEWDRAFLRQRWNRIRERFKPVAEKMQCDFQDVFVRAYGEGSVPPLDYNKLEEYDWKSLHQWTMAQLSTPTKISSELPSNRSKLEVLYQVKDQYQHNEIDYYEARGAATIPRRYSIIHKESSVVPLAGTKLTAKDVDELSLAKNWIRANVVTPQETYSPEFSRTKLLAIGDANLGNAVRELLQARIISQENKGRAVPGRTFDISEHFISRLKLNLETTHFRQAVAYKGCLDSVFGAKGKSMFSCLAADGEMLALINLIATGRLRMRQKDVRKHEYGLMDGGYRTRQIKKERLNFTVEFEPSRTYCKGNPLLPLPDRPRCILRSDDTDEKKFPAWVDINGDVVPVIWNLVLAAILGTLAIRPGTNTADLARWMMPSLEAFEIQLIMRWLVEARAASWTNKSLNSIRLEEWWWMALEGDEGNGQVSKV